MEFGVLGPLLVRGAAGDLTLGSRQQRRLLAALLAHAGSVVSTDRLLDVLWGDEPPPTAVSSLYAYLSRLRGVLHADGVEVLLNRPPGYLLRIDGAQTDAGRFERLLTEARAAAADDPGAALERLDEARALWRGPAYAEFADADFARAEATRLEELRLVATEERFDAQLALGRHADLVGEIEGYAVEHPLRERPRGQLMLALYRCGRHAEALAAFRAFRDRLDEDLGVEPSTALRDLESAILRQEPHLQEPHPPGPRPQGTSTPEARPPEVAATGATSPESPARTVGNLPAATVSLVGREHDVAAVTEALTGHRLVTVTGMGGVGKTRLALHTATAVQDRYPHGVCFCELAPVADGADVLPALATAVGATRQPGRTVEQSVLAYLAPRRLLLVVDNCEHVLDEASRLMDAVVRECPQVTVLATSRTPLGVPGECLHPTAPLPVPQPDADPARSPAVRLFLDRARAVRPDLDLGAENLAHIGEVCRRLDGLPLSLELAAARIRSLNPADLAARIGDPFRLLVAPRSTVAPRHRTLRSVVDWSYALLTPAEQRLLARLSVFVGGFTLAAAEQVGADDEQVCADDGLVDLLAALVDNSLVTVGSTAGQVRYAMLETLRAYGGELLAARGDVATMRRAHARYYAAFAGRADRGLRGPDEAIWTRVLDADYDNLRAAHRWAMENADADAALRLSAGLYYYVLYQFRDETVSWAQAAIMLPDAEAHELYTTVCGAVGEGLTLRGEIGQARLLAERALTRITDPDDRRRVPLLKLMTAVTLYEGHLDDCFAWAAEHLRLARRYDDAAYVAEALLFQGLSRTYAGDPAGGLAIADENLGVATAIGNPNLTAWARYGQAEALAHADPDTAVHRYRQAIALAETARSPFTVTIAEVGLAALLARSGDTGDALRAFRRTVDRWYRMQVWHHQWTTLRNLGRLLVRIRAHEEATVLLAAVDAAGSAAFGADADDAAHAADVLQGALGAGAYAAATARGAAMDADGTVAFALATIDRILPRSSAESHSSADSEQ